MRRMLRRETPSMGHELVADIGRVEIAYGPVTEDIVKLL